MKIVSFLISLILFGSGYQDISKREALKKTFLMSEFDVFYQAQIVFIGKNESDLSVIIYKLGGFGVSTRCDIYEKQKGKSSTIEHFILNPKINTLEKLKEFFRNDES